MSRKKMKNEKIPVVFGIDISTQCTGICIINAETGELVHMYHEQMNKVKKKKPVLPTFWSKVDHMKKAFDENHNENWDIQIVAVEESAKRFPPGMSSADTIITLSKFNAILCYILYKKYEIEPSYLNVRTARKNLGIKINYKDKSKTTKQKVLNYIVNKHPDFPWVYRTTKDGTSLVKINEDRADAYVMAEAARLILL
jgi:hypothetical protein